MKGKMLEELQALRARKQPAVMVTWLDSGCQALVEPHAASEYAEDVASAIESALRDDRSRRIETSEGAVFVHVFNPPLRLIVVGAVHIAQFLVPMAEQLGYAVTVIDPRRSFATVARFPGVVLETDWPDEAMQRLRPDHRTAVITLTHDPKLDDPALAGALGSPAFYIGSLGSRRTHERRLQRLREAGFDDGALSRIHGPLGLDLGGRSPQEIALAACAQMTAVLRGGRAP